MALRANKIQSPTKWYRDVFCQWIEEDLEIEINPSLVKHIPTFENIANFQAEKFQDWHVPQSANIVLYLGRCDPEKKIERLIQYHGVLKRRLDKRGVLAEMPHLIITGAGPKHYIEKLKNLSAKCSIANHVRFVGRYAHEVGMCYVQMPNVKVVIFPSDNETQGLCLGEAMQHKVCLALERTALEEVIEFSELTIPNDPELFTEAVEVILSSEETRLALTQRLRQVATKHTDKGKYTANLINISRELSRP